MRVPEWIEELVHFGLTGASGLVANVLLLSVFVEIGRVSEPVAAVLSTGTVMFGTFLLTDRWVFDTYETRSGSWLRRVGSYYGVMVTAKGINYGIYLLLLRLDVRYQVAWIVGSVLVFAGTFSVNRFLWRSRFG
jgi:putative flippase GtrA